MDKNERSGMIPDLLQRDHKADVNELAERFHTSRMTIRRDLNRSRRLT